MIIIDFRNPEYPGYHDPTSHERDLSNRLMSGDCFSIVQADIYSIEKI